VRWTNVIQAIAIEYSVLGTTTIRHTDMSSEQPTVLVIGATGQTGRLIVADLDRDPGNVRLRLAARKQADIQKMQAAGKDAVHLDLDDPKTFGMALAGVDRLFLLTGYTVDMLVQSKTLVDAAKKAGVSHIVHQGIFGQWDCTDPHFAWHQMIEKYIEASGIAWTHLHPNVFMDNLLTFFAPRGGKATSSLGSSASVGLL
jgi:NAD(P)H dehydrogenase (quinone)